MLVRECTRSICPPRVPLVELKLGDLKLRQATSAISMNGAFEAEMRGRCLYFPFHVFWPMRKLSSPTKSQASSALPYRRPLLALRSLDSFSPSHLTCVPRFRRQTTPEGLTVGALFPSRFQTRLKIPSHHPVPTSSSPSTFNIPIQRSHARPKLTNPHYGAKCSPSTESDKC